MTTKKAGAGRTVTITAEAQDGSGVKATYKITIMKHAVKSVKISAKTKQVKAGRKLTLKAVVKTTGKKVNKTLKWSSSNTKYATVNAKGVVTAKKAGKGKKVKITAMATDGSGKKATCWVKVKENPNTSSEDGKTTEDVASTETTTATTENKTTFYYTVNGAEAEVRDLSAEVSSGVLAELPSIRDAFSRFCYLAGIGGLNVCPYPSEFLSSSSTVYFTSGELAMLVQQISSSALIEKSMGDAWGMAPLPQYKVYTDPSDPMCDTVQVAGKTASHSRGVAMSINAKSKVMDEAYVFVNWFATEGQKTMAESGYLSARKEDAQIMMEKLPYDNNQVVVSAVESSKPGDWWYMPDRSWIDTWANPLNNEVRYGTLAFDEYLYSYVDESNMRLEEYKQ